MLQQTCKLATHNSNMRKLLFFALFLFVVSIPNAPSKAQTASGDSARFTKYFAGTPSGSCNSTDQAIDTTNHLLYICGSGSAWAAVVNASTTLTIASGAKALATGAISSATCTSAQTATATGTLTTDTIIATFNADTTGVTGYIPSTNGMLVIFVYPTADTFNAKVCNNTTASITPGAVTLNWRVVR